MVYDYKADNNRMGNNIHTTRGDEGSLLVVRRMCIVPPSRGDQWINTNIFRYTCMIKDEV